MKSTKCYFAEELSRSLPVFQSCDTEKGSGTNLVPSSEQTLQKTFFSCEFCLLFPAFRLLSATGREGKISQGKLISSLLEDVFLRGNFPLEKLPLTREVFET